VQLGIFANYGGTVKRLIAGLLYLQHALDLSFWVDPITNRNYCGCLGWVLSLVKLRVASLVRATRAIVEKIVASPQNTGPRTLGQTGNNSMTSCLPTNRTQRPKLPNVDRLE